MPIKDAIEAPRTHHQWLPDKVFLEENSFNSEIVNGLANFNHEIDYKRSIGEANCIMYDKSRNLFFGVADDRRNGKAIGY